MTAPLYQTVIDNIVARIAAGDLLPGSMLPSEFQLAADTGVSQGTARKSLMMLEQLGIVRREQGRGTFVTARTPESALFNFFRLREADGTMVRPELGHELLARRPATSAEAGLLDGAPSEVFEIRRIRTIRDVPTVHETVVVSVLRFPGLDLRSPLPNTLYVLYQQAYGCIVLRADESISAMAADEAVARALRIAPGTPVLCIDRVAYDILGHAIEWRRSLCRTDSLVYKVSLT
ncbi:GntR family transcriptional regulator [Pseudogemmobacter sonorensis]|uniref:GntR family transcriptional regulator n=1 Tax=Pseudogemmobacter sonorensis TaxID=2989681 RepID=UPI0036B60BD1